MPKIQSEYTQHFLQINILTIILHNSVANTIVKELIHIDYYNMYNAYCIVIVFSYKPGAGEIIPYTPDISQPLVIILYALFAYFAADVIIYNLRYQDDARIQVGINHLQGKTTVNYYTRHFNMIHRKFYGLIRLNFLSY